MAFPFLAAAIGASALSGAASGYLNYRAAQNTNEEARRQFEENLRFQKYQYEDSKRYNSFENQVKLARYANLNPSLLFGSGASGVGTSPVGGVAPNASMTTPDMSFIPSAFSNMVGALSQANLNTSAVDLNKSQTEKNVQEAEGQRMDNLYKDEFWKSSNYLRNAQAWLFDKQADISKLSYQYDLQSMGDRLFQQRWQSEIARADAESKLIVNAFLPERCRQEINSLITNQKVAVQQGVASLKSAMAAIMQATNQQHAFDAQYGGDPKQRSQFFSATLKSFEESIRTQKSSQYKNFFGGTPLYRTGHWADGFGDIHRVGNYSNHYYRP